MAPSGLSSGGEVSFSNIRRVKSPPQLLSSSNSLSKNILSTTEKTIHQNLDDDQPCDFFKKRNRMNKSHQKSRNMNDSPSWNKECSKNSSGKRQSKSHEPHVSLQLRSSPVGVSQPAAGKLKESVSTTGRPEWKAHGSRCQGASGNRLFLDFESMKIMKEDADEDSASDLSDSERIPIPPSPLTPPDLNLRAEEIDPGSFNLHPSQGHAEPKYPYPDFLPPPFSSWDLQDMAVLLNTEGKAEAMPRVGGPLGRYINRLLQLAWLQVQTMHSEKSRGGKSRPSLALGSSGALKSPGRSKLLASALSKPLPHPEGALKFGPSRKKSFHHEEVHPSYCASETCPRPIAVPGHTRLCSQKQTPEMRTEEKKKRSSRSTRLQPWDLPCGDSSPRMEASSNKRIPKQPAVMLDSPDSCRVPRTQAQAQLKKKGTVSNCGHVTISSEKKLKTNGVKQSISKLK